MSGQAQTPRSVLITFSTLYAPPKFEYPERRVILECKGPGSPIANVEIGRTSRRVQELGAKENNLYFDSPVMSRHHAEILVEWRLRKVFVKDTGSLHGTHLNNIRLHSGESQELFQDNILKFGIDIQRSTEAFPPCTVQVQWEWDYAFLAPEKINNRPTFTVPDDSDSSENDDDESDIIATVEKVRNIEQYRSNRPFGPFPSIDLTEETPKPTPVANRLTVATIVIDDDVPQTGVPVAVVPEVMEVAEVAVSDVADIPWSSQRSSDVAMDIDAAPHDPGAEILDQSVGQYYLDSDAESDDSYEESSHPDEMSSDGISSVEEKICLRAIETVCIPSSVTSSDSEEQSNDEQSVSNSDSEQEGSGDDADMEGSVDDETNDNDSVDEDDSHVDEPAEEVPTSPQQQSALDKVEDKPASILPLMSHAPSVPSVLTSSRSMLSAPLLNLPPWTIPPQQFAEENKLPPLLLQDNRTILNLYNSLSAQPSKSNPALRSWQRCYTPGATLQGNSWRDQNDGPSVESLGRCSGKQEYFMARELNKAKMQRQELYQPSPEPPQPPAAAKATVNDAVPQPRLTNFEAPKSTPLVPMSPWMVTGEKFLGSPQEPPQSSMQQISPKCDKTNAYHFLPSQLVASSVPKPIPQPTNNNDKHETEEFSKCLKRKSDDISTLCPEEQTAEVSASTTGQQTEDMTQSATANGEGVVAQTATGGNTAVETAKLDQSPAKRLRFLPSWKGVGTFGAGISAGGIMIASMLAMSAPNL